ncbi:hypothetical protein [Sphingomonas elodea]|uniref:hypothetical protein n=1 Tax=Sphingomonas elodea TaxID=179878 RepID=UPI0002631E5D|nr:hypothetical protein [Sphingomonas elodea]
MPYLLKEYLSGATLAASSHAPEATDAAERFAQPGWSPQAARLPLLEGAVYRLDDPRTPGLRRRVRVDRVNADDNAITYTIEGEVCTSCCLHQHTEPVAA